MLSQLKIGSRLALAFGLLLALLCAMAATAAWQASRLAANTQYYVDNLVPSYESEHAIALAVADLRQLEFQHLAANSDAEMDHDEAEMAGLRKQIADEQAHYAKELVSDDTDRDALNAVGAALAAYYAEWEKIRPISRATSTDPSKSEVVNQAILGESAKAYARAQAAIAKWWAYNVKLSADQAVAAAHAYDSARITLAAMVAAALALGTGAALLITRSIVVPIRRAVQVATTVAEGDLRSDIDDRGRDETSQLLHALRLMNDNLRDIVGRVRLSSDSIATGSAQIATGNQDLSQRTEEQASNLQQTAASMEELGSTVRTNAQTADQANAMAAEASASAADGGAAVDRVVATMQEIADSSRRIADIIGVIDGIAFQTNILALNAAVEAARAGEQGRGFAVVASEVRSLASRSAEAAREIKSLIGANVERVEAGNRQAGEAGASMSEIVGRVQRVSQLINQISGATNEQSDGISLVGNAVTQLDQVTQQNAALVEESAAAAESLKVQAATLAETVKVFRIDGGTTSASA